MAKSKTKNRYCYTFKAVVKMSDVEDEATISDKLEANGVLDAFDATNAILDAINSRCQGYYYLQSLYKDED